MFSDETAESANVHTIMGMITILLGEASPNKMIHDNVNTEKEMCIEKWICGIKLNEILVELLALRQVILC